MKLQTTGGKEECGLAGDFLVWDMSLKEQGGAVGSSLESKAAGAGRRT